MRRIWIALCLAFCLGIPAAHAADVTDLLKSIPLPAATGPAQDSGTVASGLKEALSVGTKNAV
ncbi:MAG TPA: hypothetical protein PLH28_08905, partial [Syntrophales bacterium]|nr:hypothetical protein [Syntrophales bacterium]